jgi:Acetyltransferase (GNAT) family.
MSNDYKIVPLKGSYYKNCVKLLNKEWQLGRKQSHATGDICAWIYLFEILRYSDKLLVYIQNDEILGFVGYLNYKKPKKKIRKTIYSTIYHLLFFNPKIKDRKALKNYYETYSYTPQKLESTFDGELSIIIVNNENRSKGIGTKLFDEIIKYAKASGMQNMKIDTDDSCGVQFYEKKGCIKKFTTKIEMGEKIVENAYTYEKVL